MPRRLVVVPRMCRQMAELRKRSRNGEGGCDEASLAGGKGRREEPRS